MPRPKAKVADPAGNGPIALQLGINRDEQLVILNWQQDCHQIIFTAEQAYSLGTAFHEHAKAAGWKAS